MWCWSGGWTAGGRSVTDLLATLQELEHLGVGFVSLTEALDLTTPAGRAMAGLLAIFAEFEREILRERTRAGLANARQNGKRLGRPATAAIHAAEVRKLHFMARRQPGPQPTWTNVKAELAAFDRQGLLGLIQDLYAAHKDNQTFLHARFGLGEDVLKPYKEALDRWLWPDVMRNQDTSVVKAKQAISSYRKAVGEPAGLAELMVFYCECAAGFCNEVGYQEDGYFNALVHTCLLYTSRCV